MGAEKPFSQACENNKEPILQILKLALKDASKVLEIGAGTGQHAVHFAPALPHLEWHTADQAHYHEGLNLWLQEYPSENLKGPIDIKLPNLPWPSLNFDAFYTANTAHIMQQNEVQYMMQTISEQLPEKGVFCQYGPFSINGEFSSQSNLDFHHKLLHEGYGGYRDIAELKEWVSGLSLIDIIDMPANNLFLLWRKS